MEDLTDGDGDDRHQREGALVKVRVRVRARARARVWARVWIGIGARVRARVSARVWVKGRGWGERWAHRAAGEGEQLRRARGEQRRDEEGLVAWLKVGVRLGVRARATVSVVA